MTIVLKNIRFAYPSLFEKNSYANSTPKYETMVLIPKIVNGSPNPELATLQKHIEDAKKAAAQKYSNKKLPSKFHNPLMDGDDKAEGNEENFYFSNYYLKARTSAKPPIMRLSRNPETGLVEKTLITEPDDIKGGDYGMIAFTLFHYTKVGDGFSPILVSVMKTKDGASIGGIDGAKAFDSVEIELSENDLLDDF